MAGVNNMRVVADNAADRATLTASSSAGALVQANLLTDTKSDVWRASGTSARLTLIWVGAETIGCVALPFCNLSPTATMRVRVTNEAQVTNLFTYSDQFDNVAWSKTRATTPSTNGLAPDGTNTAETLQGDGTGTAYAFQGRSLTLGTSYNVSVFVKAGTYAGAFQIHDFTDGGTVQVNLTSLALIVSGNFSAAKLDTYPNGWYRLSATVTPLSTGTKNIGFFNANTTGNVLMWGAMLAAGGLSSYYPSGSASGTRPHGYIDSWQSYAYDSGAVLACPAGSITPRGFTAAQAASAYAFGGGAAACHWLPAAKVAGGIAIDISDPDNLQGYIEAARLVAGPYWSPKYNASSAPMTPVDTTDLYRTDAGDQGADAGYIYRRLPIDLSLMPAADRAAFVNILRNSRAYPLLVSVFPGSADLALERDNMVYGRRSKNSEVAIQYALSYSTTIEIEEI